MVREIAVRTADGPTYVALARACRAWARLLSHDVVAIVEHVLRTSKTPRDRLPLLRVVAARDLWPAVDWTPLTQEVWPAALRGHRIVAAGGYARAQLLKACRAARLPGIPPQLSEQYTDVDLWCLDEVVDAASLLAVLSPGARHRELEEGYCPGTLTIDHGCCIGSGVPVQLMLNVGTNDHHLRHCVGCMHDWDCTSGQRLLRGDADDDDSYCCLYGRFDEATTPPRGRPGAPCFLSCFDQSAPAVAFNDTGVWLTPLAAYALLTGRSILHEGCLAHAPPRMPPARPEHRVFQRAAKYTALGYSVVARSLGCTTQTGDWVTPLVTPPADTPLGDLFVYRY